MAWIQFQFELFQEGRARIIEPIAQNHPYNNLFYAVSQLLVGNLDKGKDIGAYKCLVADDAMNRHAAEINIVDIFGKFVGVAWNKCDTNSISSTVGLFTISGTQESFIDIIEPNGKYNMRVTPKIHEVKWVVDVRGSPAPTLIWRDREGDDIPWSNGNQKGCKYEAIANKQSVTLKIKDIRTTDTGDYTLYADNGRVQKQQKFHLDVLNISRKKPKPTNSCANCAPLLARLHAAEQQVNLLKRQLQQTKALNDRLQSEQIKYRDLYLNHCNHDRDNLV